MAKIRVNIPDSAWEKSETSLHLAVEINGVVHHMEALEVKLEERDGASYQAVVNPANACTFDALSDMDPSAGPLFTVEIHGRPHVIAMMPGGR